MDVVTFDTETELIRPGTQAAEIVCLSYEEEIRGVVQPAGLMHWSENTYPTVKMWLEDENILLVGHEISYDMTVLAAMWPDLIPLIFQAYEDNRVTDTLIRQQLLDIAAGCFRGKMGDDNVWVKYNYALDALAHRFLNKKLDKDTWRLRYGELRYTPLKDWPPSAVEYPLEDARTTGAIYRLQYVHEDKLEDQYRQARAAFALKLCSTWGLRTDPEGVETFIQATQKRLDEIKERLVEAGLIRKDGTRNIAAAQEAMIKACAECGVQVPQTKKGAVAMDKDSCTLVDDDLIHDYSEYQTLAKNINNDGKMLRSGTIFPIHPRYGLADTGRSTCTGPNVQALKR